MQNITSDYCRGFDWRQQTNWQKRSLRKPVVFQCPERHQDSPGGGRQPFTQSRVGGGGEGNLSWIETTKKSKQKATAKIWSAPYLFFFYRNISFSLSYKVASRWLTTNRARFRQITTAAAVNFWLKCAHVVQCWIRFVAARFRSRENRDVIIPLVSW